MIGALLGGAAYAAGFALGGGGNNQSNKLLDDSIFDIRAASNFKIGLYKQAEDNARAGAKFQADVYRQAGNIAVLTSNANAALDEQQTNRTIDVAGRQVSDTIATNFASTAANGISIGSKSTQIVQNEVLNIANREMYNLHNDSLQRQSAIKYEGLLTQMSYENQARAATYSGEIQAQSYENQAIYEKYQADTEIYKIKMDNLDSNSGGMSAGEAGIGQAAALAAVGL